MTDLLPDPELPDEERDEALGTAVALAAACLRHDPDAADLLMRDQDPVPVVAALTGAWVKALCELHQSEDAVRTMLGRWRPGLRLDPDLLSDGDGGL